MKRQLIQLLTIFLLGILVISCEQNTPSTNSENDNYKGVDWVIVYQDDASDSIPKDKVVYQAAWGNTVDSLKPKFDLHFCNENFQFPFYFPEISQLKGKAGTTITTIENEQLETGLRTNYTMTYDNQGRIASYSISGPSTIYSCTFNYDPENSIQQISDNAKKIRIAYNDFGNIETVTEISADEQSNKSLKFTYTYVAFPRR